MLILLNSVEQVFQSEGVHLKFSVPDVNFWKVGSLRQDLWVTNLYEPVLSEIS